MRSRQAQVRQLQVRQSGGVGLHPLRRPVALPLPTSGAGRGSDTAVVQEAAGGFRDVLEVPPDAAEEAAETPAVGAAGACLALRDQLARRWCEQTVRSRRARNRRVECRDVERARPFLGVSAVLPMADARSSAWTRAPLRRRTPFSFWGKFVLLSYGRPCAG